jgi:transketolase
VFEQFRRIEEQPKLLVARTIKGCGVSFMEHPQALRDGEGTYRWHAGAPGDEDFARAFVELRARIDEHLERLGLTSLELERVDELAGDKKEGSLEGEPESGAGARPKATVTDEYVADAFGEALLELAERNERLVVLDADLASDCRVRAFELRFPERFIETGIAEQDMVSMAGGLARQGLIPVVNSFASFLASRANEQIYNNASELSKVIYALHYAGLIPAGPGKSHQSVRDISLLAALPNCAIVQPANSEETRTLLRWAIEEAEENVAVRLAIGPSPRRIELPSDNRLRVGQGALLREGGDALLIAYGPVMLHEALTAAELLSERGLAVAVCDMPWLNRFDRDWLAAIAGRYAELFVVEDHAIVGGLGDGLRRELSAASLLDGRNLHVFGVEGYPACGTPAEALRFHKLDGVSLAERVEQRLGSVRSR